jgi:hypothetical protein
VSAPLAKEVPTKPRERSGLAEFQIGLHAIRLRRRIQGQALGCSDPPIDGSSAASRGSIRPAGSGFQHTSQLPHKVTEHGPQDGGDDDKE